MKHAGRLALLAIAASLVCQFVANGQDFFPRIINGEPTDEFESVGIVNDQLFGICTGTLITPRHVLTAAHCAEEIFAGSGSFELDGVIYAIAQVHIHPDYNDITFDNDIAILELTEDIEGIEVSPILRRMPMVDEVLTIVGYGLDGDAQGIGDDSEFGTKRVGTTTIQAVSDTLVSWDFDDPTESNTAPGDSGGPGFLLEDGIFYIACITSGGTEADAGLGDNAFNTRVDAFAFWIDGVVALADIPDEPEETPEQPEETPDEPEQDEEPASEDDEMVDCPPHHGGGHFGHRPWGHRRPGRHPAHKKPSTWLKPPSFGIVWHNADRYLQSWAVAIWNKYSQSSKQTSRRPSSTKPQTSKRYYSRRQRSR